MNGLENSFDLNRVNAFLTFADAAFRVIYVSTNEKRDELFKDGFLDTPDPLKNKKPEAKNSILSEAAGDRLKEIKGMKTVEFNKYLQPELLAAIKTFGVDCVVAKNSKNGNLLVCYHESQSSKMRDLEKMMYRSCKNMMTDMKTLKNINATVEGATIRTTPGLSALQYHALCEQLPKMGVSFVGRLSNYGGHTISFSSVDDAKISQCIKDIGEMLKSADAKEMQKTLFKEDKLFREIESKIKNGETVYIASEQFGKYLEIKPDKFTVLEEKENQRIVPLASRNNPIEGNVFKNSIWLNMSQHIIDAKNPILLTKEEMEQFINSPLKERDEMIQDKTFELGSGFEPKEIDDDMEKLEHFADELNAPDKEKEEINIDELE